MPEVSIQQLQRAHADIKEFTKSILNFWARNGQKFKEWAKAARIIFSFTASSAACERVFSLVKFMFGDLQDHTLADIIQAALMLRYNKRQVG